MSAAQYTGLLLKRFQGQKREEWERIADYLDEIAQYATKLAGIWSELLEEYSSGTDEVRIDMDKETFNQLTYMLKRESRRPLAHISGNTRRTSPYSPFTKYLRQNNYSNLVRDLL